jgi:molecular chaperone GrpE
VTSAHQQGDPNEQGEAREQQETAAPGAPGPEAGQAPAGEQPTGVDEDSSSDLGPDLAQAQQAVADLTADLKRVHADYANYKKRVDRDRQLVYENAKFSVLSALLPVLDDFDRARSHGELEGGFKAVADSLERIVAGQGLVKFGAPGDEFDPRYHEALMHAHSPDVTTTTCQTIVSAGYQIGDRVVRPAQVTVVDPEPEAEAGPDNT